jgi:hypothetical protein
MLNLALWLRHEIASCCGCAASEPEYWSVWTLDAGTDVWKKQHPRRLHMQSTHVPILNLERGVKIFN